MYYPGMTHFYSSHPLPSYTLPGPVAYPAPSEGDTDPNYGRQSGYAGPGGEFIASGPYGRKAGYGGPGGGNGNEQHYGQQSRPGGRAGWRTTRDNHDYPPRPIPSQTNPPVPRNPALYQSPLGAYNNNVSVPTSAVPSPRPWSGPAPLPTPPSSRNSTASPQQRQSELPQYNHGNGKVESSKLSRLPSLPGPSTNPNVGPSVPLGSRARNGFAGPQTSQVSRPLPNRRETAPVKPTTRSIAPGRVTTGRVTKSTSQTHQSKAARQQGRERFVREHQALACLFGKDPDGTFY